MAPSLEQMARETNYRHNSKLCTALDYFGIALIGTSVIDAVYTYITGNPVVSHYLDVNQPNHEYFLDSMLLGVGLFAAYESIIVRKIIEKERVSKK